MPHPTHIERCACPAEAAPPTHSRKEPRHRRSPWAERLCPTCGVPVRVQLWALTAEEAAELADAQLGFAWATAQSADSVEPDRANVKRAADDLATLSAPCDACFGTGVDTDWDGSWRTCPYCLGIGRTPKVPLAELQAAHQSWFGRWPTRYRRSLLFGIPTDGHLGQSPRYDGSSLPFHPTPDRQVVFGPIPYATTRNGEQAWAFTPLQHARRRANTLQAFWHAKTWGEARRATDPAEHHFLESDYEIDQDDDTPFTMEKIWPEGQTCAPMDDGPWWPPGVPYGEEPPDAPGMTGFATSELPGVLRHLDRHGFHVIRDDLLMSAAMMVEPADTSVGEPDELDPNPHWPHSMLFHVPHASRIIPTDAREQIVLPDAELELELDRLTDHHVNTLLVPPNAETRTITAPVSRLVVDVERFIDDAQEPMARVGLGAVYTLTSDGRPLKRSLTDDERQQALQAYYHPHHTRLTAAVDRALADHDHALILDLHSFPDPALPCDQDQQPQRPDLCIGTDTFHTPPALVEALAAQLETAGFTVEIDRPYAGTIVPLKHLHTDARVMSVMIEVNRRLYVEQGTNRLKQDAHDTGRTIQACVWRAVVDTLEDDGHLAPA